MYNTLPHDSNTHKTGPKDVFLHLAVMLALYFSAGSFITLMFQYANLLFPDIVDYGLGAGLGAVMERIRWAIASLIVIFPLYVLTTRYLHRLYDREPEKRNLKTRKWLLYFTLFVSAVIIAGDLVSLVNNFLQGELTVRFFLKVLTIMFVAGCIFYYYFQELKNAQKQGRFFEKAVIATVVIAVIAGFFVVESPKTARLRRHDDIRIQDLTYLQGRIISYWQKKGILPENLQQLVDGIEVANVPTDPITGQAYGYTAKGELTFELCATFEVKSQKNPEFVPAYQGKPRPPADMYYEVEDVAPAWIHKAGYQCFERTIDKDRFKPQKT